MTLYELTGEYAELLDIATNPDIELGDTDVIAEALERLEGDIQRKLLGIARVLRSLDAESGAIKAEIDRLAERKKRAENNAERLKEYAKAQMEWAGIDKAKDDLFTVALQKNPPRLESVNEAKVPAQYWLPQPPKLDRRGLLAAAKEGKVDKSVCVVVQDKGVRIR